ncbi:hypothetical protein PSEUDO8O_140017 [Pseudomonas sp. 8O]|nr:hypothetical protein PSEUDO8O_140017 [Pseudomonas sp. 8O]
MPQESACSRLGRVKNSYDKQLAFNMFEGAPGRHKAGALPAKLLECRALLPLRIVSWRPTVPAVCARSSVSMNSRSWASS